jgi:hypothetical protein
VLTEEAIDKIYQVFFGCGIPRGYKYFNHAQLLHARRIRRITNLVSQPHLRASHRHTNHPTP